MRQTTSRPPRVKTLSVRDRHIIPEHCPNFSVTGSVRRMRKLYYGNKALLVRCGYYIFNVSDCPEVYEAAH